MAGVFRKYDIRGVYPDELDDGLAYKVGRAIVRFFSAKKIAVGHDHRKSSPSLHDTLIEGIINQGVDVVDLGFCSSPELYNYNVKNSIPGVMITASHNPLNYNGIKINSYDGRMIDYPSGLKDIEGYVNDDEIEDNLGEKGKVTKLDHGDDYVSYLISKIDIPDRTMKVVVDAGNGTAGPTLEKIFSQLKNVELVPLFFEPDNENPKHQADPTKKENIVELSDRIRKEGADFGAAFDGDSDRCIFLDERGVPIGADIFMCIIADNESKKDDYPGAYYFDLWSSRSVKKRMKELGCEYDILPLGAANYREKLVLDGGVAAAEGSGHVMFSDNMCQDDGFFTLLKMIEYYGSSGKTISAMVAPYSLYFSEHESIRCRDPDSVLHDVKLKYSDGGISEIDGVTVEYKDWWFNIRKSNTEPLVRFKVEATTPELLKEKMDEITGLVRDA